MYMYNFNLLPSSALLTLADSNFLTLQLVRVLRLFYVIPEISRNNDYGIIANVTISYTEWIGNHKNNRARDESI